MASRAAGVAAADPKRFVRVLSQSLGGCAPQASIYGGCVIANMDTIQKDACLQQWKALDQCMKDNMKPGRR